MKNQVWAGVVFLVIAWIAALWWYFPEMHAASSAIFPPPEPVDFFGASR